MSVIWSPSFNGVTDSDAAAWIDAVETADNAELEHDVVVAVNKFVTNLKLESLWHNIRGCGILAGARTLNGALIPLKGPAVTNNGFIAAEYDRELGLQGTHSSAKYIDTNVDHIDEEGGNQHMSVYTSNLQADGDGIMMSAAYYPFSGTPPSGPSTIRRSSSSSWTYWPGGKSYSPTNSPDGPGLFGWNCYGTNQAEHEHISSSTLAGVINPAIFGSTPVPKVSSTYYVFDGNGNADPGSRYNGKISWWSFGSSLDLVKLDTHVSTLFAELAAAIP